MGYKKIDKSLDFAELVLATSLKHNRSLVIMDQINSEILRQYENQGLTINEGVAIDARLVKSASSPISKDKIKSLKGKNPPRKIVSIKTASPRSSPEI